MNNQETYQKIEKLRLELGQRDSFGQREDSISSFWVERGARLLECLREKHSYQHQPTPILLSLYGTYSKHSDDLEICGYCEAIQSELMHRAISLYEPETELPNWWLPG